MKTSSSLFRIIVFAIALCIGLDSFAQGRMDVQLARLRNVKGKNIVKCSPEGDGGEWLEPGEALRKLKRGDTLLLAPGIYKTDISIDIDNITVECDGSQDTGVNRLYMKVNGSGCVLRNVRLIRVDIKGECSIVDSVVSRVYYDFDCGSKKKPKFFIGNSIIGYLQLYSYERELDVDIYKCTLYDDGTSNNANYPPLIYTWGRMKFNIEKCLFYGRRCMVFNNQWSGKTKLSIDTCSLYGSESLARNGRSWSGDTGPDAVVARELKELRKVCTGNVNIKGKNFVGKPNLINPPKFSLYWGYDHANKKRNNKEEDEDDLSGLAFEADSQETKLEIGVSFNEKKFPGVSSIEKASKPASR